MLCSQPLTTLQLPSPAPHSLFFNPSPLCCYPNPRLTQCFSTLVPCAATLTRAFLRTKAASKMMPARDALPEQSAGNVSVYQDARSVANGSEAASATTAQEAEKVAEASDDEDVFVDAETDNEEDGKA